MLTVEFVEEAELRPSEVDAPNEHAVPVVDHELPCWFAEGWHCPGKLEHQRFEKALCRGRTVGPERQDAPNPTCPRRSRACHRVERVLHGGNCGQLLAKGRLERLLPSEI